MIDENEWTKSPKHEMGAQSNPDSHALPQVLLTAADFGAARGGATWRRSQEVHLAALQLVRR